MSYQAQASWAPIFQVQDGGEVIDRVRPLVGPCGLQDPPRKKLVESPPQDREVRVLPLMYARDLVTKTKSKYMMSNPKVRQAWEEFKKRDDPFSKLPVPVPDPKYFRFSLNKVRYLPPSNDKKLK